MPMGKKLDRPRLTYFAAHGRVDPCRFMYNHAGAKYDEVNIT